MLFWLGENRPRAPFEACFNLIRPNKMALTFDLDFKIFLNVINVHMAFDLIEIDHNIITFEQVDPDICHFIDLSIVIGGHLGNMQKKMATG